MIASHMKVAAGLVLLVAISQAIFIPIGLNERRCMAAFTAFEPLKLEADFPKLPNQTESQQFRVTLQSSENATEAEQTLVKPGSVLRRQLRLKTGTAKYSLDVVYSICFELLSDRSSFPDGTPEPRIGYLISDDLSRLIGTIDVPADIKSDKKLSDLYTYAEEIARMNAKLAEYQQRERKLEDEVAQSSLHKNFRIISLTLIECAVVILAGVYQVFTLRRFLIDKNLY